MITAFFKAVFYQPLYNGLIFLFDTLPWADAGLVVILFTALVKLALFPLSKKSIKTQMVMKKIQPELDQLKTKYKDDREGQARAMMALYREKKLNPLSGILVVLIQLPIIFAIYWIFFKGGLPAVNTDLLYSFIQIPANIDMHLFGVIDISQKNVILAVLTGVTQFFQMKFALPKLSPRKEGASFKDDLARSMNLQMKYIMPIFIIVIAYQLPVVVSLYWITSNLFAIGQELVVRKKYRLDETVVKA